MVGTEIFLMTWLTSHFRGDIKGAAIIGALPYLDYPRFYDLISNKLAPEVRADIVDKATSVLNPCALNPVITDAIISLAKFANIVTIARDDPTHSMKFDPDAFIEEWFWVEYKIIKYPGPLRDDTTSTIGIPPVAIDKPARLQAYNAGVPRVPSIKYSPTPDLRPTPSKNLLEPAVRLAATLYIEELIPDDPRSLNAYAILLSLLRYQVDTILKQLQSRIIFGMLLDNNNQKDGLPSFSALKPVIIWVCIVGYITSLIADKYESSQNSDRHDRTVFRECLSLIVGPTPECVDKMTESDFAMCRVLELGWLKMNDWGDRKILKLIIKERVIGDLQVRPLLMKFLYPR